MPSRPWWRLFLHWLAQSSMRFIGLAMHSSVQLHLATRAPLIMLTRFTISSRSAQCMEPVDSPGGLWARCRCVGERVMTGAMLTAIKHRGRDSENICYAH